MVAVFLTTHMTVCADDPTELFEAMKQTLQSALLMLRILYSHGLWLSRKCARRVQHHMLRYLRGYKVCADMCAKIPVAGFGLKPKYHSMHHICMEIAFQLTSGAMLVLSPLAFNCEGNEDAVGRVCRVARRVSARTVNGAVFDRLMCKTKALIRKYMERTGPPGRRRTARSHGKRGKR